jgi:PAS domain S-box-containing protein
MDDRTIPRQTFFERQKVALPASQQWGNDLHYRALFEQTGECVFIIGFDLQYMAVNQCALDLLGYEEQELIGLPVSTVMSLDDELVHASLKGDHSDLYERILNKKDGSRVPVEISTSIVYDEAGRPAYIQSIARDISERKMAEQALQRHTRVLSAISDATARLLRASDIETKIPEVLEPLGRAMDVYCCTIFEVNTFSGSPQINIQYQWTHRDTTTFDVSAVLKVLVPGLLDDPDAVLSSLTNDALQSLLPDLFFAITPIHGTLGSWGYLGLFDKKKDRTTLQYEQDAIQTAANLIGSALQRDRYEETIRLNEMRNRIIINALPDLVIRIDIDGKILDYSASPDHPLYIHRDIISERKFSQTWPEEIVDQIIGEKNRTIFSSPHWVSGFRLPFASRIYESRLHPISSVEALIVIRDVTEQELLNDAKSDFIHRASHELRTPLTSAILMADLIQGGGEPEELDEYWKILNSELNRQKILIDRLLIAGRLENGALKLERNSLDIIPILQESMLAVKPIANKKKISIRLMTEEPVLILGDNSGLQQVFINLINNAVKFSPEGKTVDIRVEQTETFVRVHISDHGLGIPAEALPHLFERFYRARNVTIAEIPGSGIGLYIVKTIVEELGGKIDVQSVINAGTIFTVCLNRAT